jgi:hypothetical protein
MARSRRKSAQISIRERMELFVIRANQLRNTRLVTSGALFQFKFKSGSSSNRPSATSPQVDRDDLRSFMSLFRQFILSNDPVNISRALSDGIRSTADKDLRERLLEMQEAWKKFYIRGGLIPTIINDETLTSECAFDLIANAGYAHNDPNRAQVLNDLEYPLPLVHMQLFVSMPTLVQIICFTADYISIGFRDYLFKFPDGG